MFDKIFSVNVKAPFEIAKRVLPSMNARGGGSIINISSIGGISPEPFLGIYSVSKAALISVTKMMAKEWGAQGICANAICPGFIKTAFSAASWKNEALTDNVLGELPLGRIGDAEKVASLALFLAAPASSYCTGDIYMVDGGHTI